MRASLTIQEGGETTRHRFVHRTVIGRDSDCAVVLTNRSVSRKHAVLEPVEGQWVLHDLSSVNGTFVKEGRVKEVRLSGGETIRFGDVRAVFEVIDEAEVSGARRLLENLAAGRGGKARPMAGLVVALVGILLLLLATLWSRRTPRATASPASAPTPVATPPAS